MRIAVCMKQVPAVSEGSMDKETGVILRAGLESVVNVYDLAALEAALQIKEQTAAEVHAFTMGPGKAEEVLREAFARGADAGYLVCDKAFAGADVLATSYTLMQALNSAGSFDLVLCGKQTTDGDTAQVSGALASQLGIPRLNWVTGISLAGNQELDVVYRMEERSVYATISLPCLLAVEKESFIPRMPSLKLKISGKKKPVTVISLAEIGDRDATHYGLSGSATKVWRIFPPTRTERKEMALQEAGEAAEYMLHILAGREE